MADPLAYSSDPEKVQACRRLELKYLAAIGKVDEDSVHVEIMPRWRHDATGNDVFTQIIGDEDIPAIVEDVNALGNVAVLNLTENDITDASLPSLRLLRNLKQLWLGNTKMSLPAVAAFKKTIPETYVSFAERDDDDEDDEIDE